MRNLTQIISIIAISSLAPSANALPPSNIALPISGPTLQANSPTATTKAVTGSASALPPQASSGATETPEPSMIVLFMLAVGGLIVGHRWHRALAKRKP